MEKCKFLMSKTNDISRIPVKKNDLNIQRSDTCMNFEQTVTYTQTKQEWNVKVERLEFDPELPVLRKQSLNGNPLISHS